MRSSDYRAAARKSLDGQWGTFALLMLSSGILSMIVAGGFGLIFGSDNSVVSTLIELLLTFAFGYGIFYASLYVVRGGKAEVGMIFSIFNGGRYLPLLLVNLVEWLVGLISSFVLALPFVGILGFSVISTMLLTGGSGNLVSSVVGFGGFSAIALLTLLFVVIVAGIGTLVDGYFQIVVLARLDFPEMKFGDVFSYAFTLLKGRLWDLFVLQLSFIGWYLLGIFIIPLLWIVPYKIVAISEFYDVAKEINELKETI